MTETTNDSELATRARELYETELADKADWDNMHVDEQAWWVEKAMATPPTARNKIRRGLNLTPLPPIGESVVQELGTDPRTHHRKEHRDFDRDWSAGTKAIKLLAKPSPEDMTIRKELLEAGLPVFDTQTGDAVMFAAGEDHETSTLVRVVPE